jgi:hypothetical protein
MSDSLRRHQSIKQTRLYVFPHTHSETLHLITLGDKSTQTDDIAFAKAYVEGLRGGDEGHEA